MEHTEEKIINDGFGLPLVIGNRYAYSRRKNGFVYITRGILGKINTETSRATLRVEYVAKALYESNVEEITESSGKTVNTLGNTLIPL